MSLRSEISDLKRELFKVNEELNNKINQEKQKLIEKSSTNQDIGNEKKHPLLESIFLNERKKSQEQILYEKIEDMDSIELICKNKAKEKIIILIYFF